MRTNPFPPDALTLMVEALHHVRPAYVDVALVDLLEAEWYAFPPAGFIVDVHASTSSLLEFRA